MILYHCIFFYKLTWGPMNHHMVHSYSDWLLNRFFNTLVKDTQSMECLKATMYDKLFLQIFHINAKYHKTLSLISYRPCFMWYLGCIYLWNYGNLIIDHISDNGITIFTTLDADNSFSKEKSIYRKIKVAVTRTETKPDLFVLFWMHISYGIK